ncbi:MAG: exosortase T, partial [Pseudomonadota bacterium]
MLQRHLPNLALASCAAASVILAIKPVRWLINSWTSPVYDSQGYIYLIAIAVLIGRSLLSGPARPGNSASVLLLLLLAAAARFAGQTLAVNTISALALVIDIYAIARLLGVDRRPVALSPFWLAVLFLFSLPVEVILQRLIGYPLQVVSAEIACGLLGLIYQDLSCTGIRIRVEDLDVLVDLPCSGATGLLLAMAFASALNAIYRPRFWVGCAMGLGVVALAVLGNGLRITGLAVGLQRGIDVMAEPTHSLIGLVTLALSLLPVALYYRPRPAPVRQGWVLPAFSDKMRLAVGAVGVCAAIVIVSA